MNNKPILVVPKGRLYTGVKSLFNEWGLEYEFNFARED